MSAGASPTVSKRLLRGLIDAALEEVGADSLPTVLSRSGLPMALIEADGHEGLDGVQAAQTYASVQQALRLFYGRGARGSLLRIGQRMWTQSILHSAFREKADLEITRRLPVPARRRRVLNLVAERLKEGGGAVSVHTLDLDLLLVDHAGAAACGQTSSEPICYVTIGLIEGAFVWALGQTPDVEEIACKATGAPACEFRVKLGTK